MAGSTVVNKCRLVGILTTFLALLVEQCESANILLAPYPYVSHIAQSMTVGSGLKERGHSVSILLPESYRGLDAIREKMAVIAYVVKYPDYYSNEGIEAGWKEDAPSMTPIEEMRTYIDGFIQLCTNPLEDETLPGKLRRLQLDLAIVDGFPGTWCLYIIMYKLGVPYVSLTTEYEAWMWRNPVLPSFVPFPLAGVFTERMTLVERIQNLITLIDWTAWPRVPYMEDSFVRKYLPENTEVTYSWLAARSLLWLIDTDVAIDYARPTMANEIYVGGLSTRPARPLSAELESFANGNSKGFIVVSFGSTGILDDEKSFGVLMSAFALLEQRIIWKYSGDIPATWSLKIPPNVLLMKWLPQNDLLGHRNCRLFVTHCGANSQFEALYHAVPMLGIPVFGDQPYNARRMQYLEYGRFTELHAVTSDDLVSLIREIISNASYLENVRRGSAIFKDRPQTPQERAVWWVEHVLRYGGRHLHSIALDMPWYEYLMLDILLVLVILPLVFATSVLTCCAVWIFYRRHAPNIKQKTN